MDEHNWKKYRWWRTQLESYGDFSGLNDLAEAEVAVSMKKDANKIQITLENKASVVAFFIRLSVKDAAGELVIPAFWSANLVTLAPGETKTYTCTLPDGCGETLEVSGWNVEDKSFDIQ